MAINGNTAEAERWLSIAEKLLNTNDFHGTKTFAIRARDSDPKLYASSQILAVADTLISGESLINNSNLRDWYDVLQVPRLTQNMELIASQYRKFALLLNPVKNRFAFADQAFRLVSEAWSVLSNPSKKSSYDNELHLVRSVQGPQPEQHRQQQPRPCEQQRQQQVQPVRKSHRKGDDRLVEEVVQVSSLVEPIGPTRPIRVSQVTEPEGLRSGVSFWTACPYCYILYEYPQVYEECTLRCQNCRRAFHAVIVPPPPLKGDKDAYFCSWGFFPLGCSENYAKRQSTSDWMPFSSLFTCPTPNAVVNLSVAEGKRKPGRQKKGVATDTPTTRVYYDDDDVYVEVSEESDDLEDNDWESENVTKKAKGIGLADRSAKKVQPEKRTYKGNQSSVTGDINVASHGNLNGGPMVQEDAPMVYAYKGETSKKAATNNLKKQTGKGSNEIGQLDLNVEFSNNNEVEETAGKVSRGNKVEDNIEGIGFFEGLDEFLSSLPILSVVGDDKVKAS